MPINSKKPKNAINYLQKSKGKILTHLNKVIESQSFDYRTFGTAIEEHLTDTLIKILTEGGFVKNDMDYIIAPDKNYFPDFELKTMPPLAIEFKSGNRSQFRKGKWVTVKNSENDMGTLGEWLKKIKRFGGENIYYIFVIYNFNDKTQEVLDVTIAPFYKFIGLNSAGTLKYREKDGNLRPKDFDANSPIKILNQFEQMISKTKIYRSKRIIKKHRLIIKKESESI